MVVAVETPAEKPRFAAMRLVPHVSSEQIQVLVKKRLATEAVIKTDGWQGYGFLDAAPRGGEFIKFAISSQDRPGASRLGVRRSGRGIWRNN